MKLYPGNSSSHRSRAKGWLRPWRWIAVAITLTLLSLIPVQNVAGSEPVALVKADVKTLAKGQRVSDLIGSTVVNEKDETIGTINDLIVDENHRLFAVLEVGGFLARGAHPLVAVPYEGLSIDKTLNRVVLPGASREELNKLPVFEYHG